VATFLSFLFTGRLQSKLISVNCSTDLENLHRGLLLIVKFPNQDYELQNDRIISDMIAICSLRAIFLLIRFVI